MTEFISKNEALEILQIKTRQGLHGLVKKFNIEIKSQGPGKPNLYNKDEVMKAYLASHKQKEKCNPSVKVKAVEKKEKKIKVAKVKEEKKKEIEEKTKNPLNETGQDEFLRVEKELKDNGTYSPLDRTLLLTYSIAFQNYMFYVDLSASLDHTTVDENGNQKVNAYLTVSDKFFAQMDKMAKTLGIGVRNRVGLEIKVPKGGSMFELLNRNRSKA